MAEPGSFRAAALLNSTAGVQRVVCVCVCVWQMGSLITREKGSTHTHTQKKKHTHTRVHQGWHFLSAPLFLRPGSPWHQRQQDSLPACGGGGWKELVEGGGTRGGGGRSGGNRKKCDTETSSPLFLPTYFIAVCGQNLKSVSLTPPIL